MGSIATPLEQKNPLTAENISDLRQLLKEHNDGSKLLLPGDVGYEDSIKRWSAAAVRRAVSPNLPSSQPYQALPARVPLCLSFPYVGFLGSDLSQLSSLRHLFRKVLRQSLSSYLG